MQTIERTKRYSKIGFYYLFVFLAFPITILASLCPAQSVHADSPSAKYLVVIVIDGCCPDYLDLVSTPNIDSLKSEGVWYTNAWVGLMNNDTPAGHTAISTGRFGKDNGIISFGWRDERLLPPRALKLLKAVRGFVTKTGWTGFGLWFQDITMGKLTGRYSPCSWQNVTSGAFTDLITETGAVSIGEEYKKIYPSAKVSAISCAKWYAAAALAAGGADYTVFADSTGIPPLTFSSLSKIRPAGMIAAPPPDSIVNDPSFVRDINATYDPDTWTADVALSMIAEKQPEVLLINFGATDDAGHEWDGTGSPEELGSVIANVDIQIGRILKEYKRSNKYDNTLFVIVSDHGMTPAVRTISQKALNSLYIESGTFATCTTHVYLLDQEKSRSIAEKIALAEIPGIHGAYYKVLQDDHTYSYEPASTNQPVLSGDLDDAYRYLLSTWASEKSPDIELITAENWHVDFLTGRGKTFFGNHDSATWLQQHIPMLIAGPGVRKGIVSDSPARLVDIAPTVLSLMDIPPQNMDGIVLADALQTPQPEHTREQTKENRKLMPLIEALKAQSNADLDGLSRR